MKEFWFTFLAGGAVATPIAFGIGLLGRHYFADTLARWLGAPDTHPAAYRGPTAYEAR